MFASQVSEWAWARPKRLGVNFGFVIGGRNGTGKARVACVGVRNGAFDGRLDAAHVLVQARLRFGICGRLSVMGHRQWRIGRGVLRTEVASVKGLTLGNVTLGARERLLGVVEG